MVNEDTCCADILAQVSAATNARETVALARLGGRLSHCVAESSAEGGRAAAERIHEANDAIVLLVRS
nr:metal-sensing transcriptional repressor [Microbacterium sp. SORGH_AS_0888]